MSFQWSLVAGFLYVELAIIVILLLPFIKPQVWRYLFQSHFMRALTVQSNLYLYSFIFILLLFFGESIREFNKYGGIVKHERNYAGSASFYEDEMRLFRGQRNFYISGFALFCLFIIKRLATLLSQQAVLQSDAKASLRQAENLSKGLQIMQTKHEKLLSDFSQLQKLVNTVTVKNDFDEQLDLSGDDGEDRFSPCQDTVAQLSDGGDKSSSKIPVLTELKRRSDLNSANKSQPMKSSKQEIDPNKSKKE